MPMSAAIGWRFAEQSDASGLPTVCFSLLQRPLCTVLVFVHRDPDRNHSYSGCGLWFSVLLAQVATMVIESDSDTEKGKAYLISMLASGFKLQSPREALRLFSRGSSSGSPRSATGNAPCRGTSTSCRSCAGAGSNFMCFVEKRIADRQRQAQAPQLG